MNPFKTAVISILSFPLLLILAAPQDGFPGPTYYNCYSDGDRSALCCNQFVSGTYALSDDFGVPLQPGVDFGLTCVAQTNSTTDPCPPPDGAVAVCCTGGIESPYGMYWNMCIFERMTKAKEQKILDTSVPTALWIFLSLIDWWLGDLPGQWIRSLCAIYLTAS
ncbi:hypothetical protein CERSUDRAFT_74696 [Gelatoporia subvermispora B]|uniref:Hydrophobin n=1 Tax=Ceriporiopsis subvermispora (strain B) TaxID=914234 RepID=M2RAT1_CERS8|nr:hypothetical protein CERSUDRAFT_74696 [Gelatoporia subvermispora B]